MESELNRIKAVADYQFGKGVGKVLFPSRVKIAFSPRTGRIRYVFLGNERLATMRPTDGTFALSILGAKRIVQGAKRGKCFVIVQNGVARFISEGGDVFAAHVKKASYDIRSGDEVIVLDENANVLAVGRSALSGEEMLAFKRGIAVKVRRGSRKVKVPHYSKSKDA